jgi:hypothetical protein
MPELQAPLQLALRRCHTFADCGNCRAACERSAVNVQKLIPKNTVPPSAKELAAISELALSLVNDAREALDMRRLFAWFKGYRHQADCCPVAYALASGSDESSIPLVNGVTILFRDSANAANVAEAWGRQPDSADHRLVVLPFAIARFTRLFDEGHYPLITKSAMPPEAERPAA